MMVLQAASGCLSILPHHNEPAAHTAERKGTQT
jgi:hypothetical protein